MRILGNIIWNFPFLGFISAFFCFLAGGFLVITVLLAPVGLGLIQYSKFLLLPFNYAMVNRSDLGYEQNAFLATYGFILKVLYIVLIGIPLYLFTLVQIVLTFCSIIGIPVAIVLAKSLSTLLQPVGKVCVPVEVYKEMERQKGQEHYERLTQNK